MRVYGHALAFNLGMGIDHPPACSLALALDSG